MSGKISSIVRSNGQRWVMLSDPDRNEGFVFDIESLVAIYPMDDEKARSLGDVVGSTVMLNDAHGSTTFVRMLGWSSKTVASMFAEILAKEEAMSLGKEVKYFDHR